MTKNATVNQEPLFAHSHAALEQIAGDVLALARQGGASASEVEVSEGFGQSVNVRQGDVETIEHHRDKQIGVTVYLGQRKGYAATSLLFGRCTEGYRECGAGYRALYGGRPVCRVARG